MVGPGLILWSNEAPWWTIGCWTGGEYSGFELLDPVFRSTPTITSIGFAEPVLWFFVKCVGVCWWVPACGERSGGLIVFRAVRRVSKT